MTHSVKIKCNSCGYGIIESEKSLEDDNFVILTYYPLGFYSYQDRIFRMIWDRVKMAYCIPIEKKIFFL